MEFLYQGIRRKLDITVLNWLVAKALIRTSFGPDVWVHRATTNFLSLSTSMISVEADVASSSFFSCTLFLYSFIKSAKVSNVALKAAKSSRDSRPSGDFRSFAPSSTTVVMADSTNS